MRTVKNIASWAGVLLVPVIVWFVLAPESFFERCLALVLSVGVFSLIMFLIGQTSEKSK